MATDFEFAYHRVCAQHAKRLAPPFEPGADVTWRDKAGDLHLGTVETDLGDGRYQVVIGWDGRGYVETVEPVAGQDLTELATAEWAEAVEAVGEGINLEDYLNARCDGADHADIMAAKRDLDLDPYEYGFDLRAGRTLSEIIDSGRAGARTLVHGKADGGTINAGRGAQAGEVTVNTGRPPSNPTWLDTVDQTVVERLLDRLDREFPDQGQYLARAGDDRRYSLWLRLADHHAARPVSPSLPLRQEYEAGWSPAEAAAVADATAGPALDTYIDLLAECHGVEL